MAGYASFFQCLFVNLYDKNVDFCCRSRTAELNLHNVCNSINF